MSKTKVAFLEGRLLSSQSKQFKNYTNSSDWMEKSQISKKPLLFCLCKQTKGRIIKANLSWNRTQAEICQLITILSVFLSLFFVLKVGLKDVKFEFCQFKLE